MQLFIRGRAKAMKIFLQNLLHLLRLVSSRYIIGKGELRNKNVISS